ncbi:MAG TPA: response regulator [Chitinophagaceae bacterium]|nr:response regulator [Chitinophagaceae bacterium]HTN17995.1 response regulator [Chitinophagaceae bacterium]
MASNATPTVFLVDDEPIQNEMLKDYLAERFNYTFNLYDNGEEALNNMRLNPEIVILDYHLNAHNTAAKNGVQILREIKERNPKTQVIMVSGQDKIQVAVDSMKYGAYDYIVKGETAFARMENTLKRINEFEESKFAYESSRKSIRFLIIAMICIIILSVLLLTNGPRL